MSSGTTPRAGFARPTRLPRRIAPALPRVGPLVYPALLAILAACSSGDTATGADGGRHAYFDPREPGPFRAGTAHTTVFDQARDRKLPLDVWYPISPDAQGKTAEYLGLLPGSAVRDAPIETSGAPFPLVVFSHGSGSVPVQNYPNCEHLATHGYVVAAPAHVGNTLFTGDPELFSRMLEMRPRDVSAVVDWMLGSEYAAYLDAGAIGVMGHSFGGYTSIAVAGAEAHPARYNAFCADPAAENQGCLLTGTFPDPVDRVSFGDARVKAALAISAGMYEIWEADGLASIEVPIMLMSGTRDDLTPHEREAVRIYAGLPAPKYLVTFDASTHLGFTILCKFVPKMPILCLKDTLAPEAIESSVNAFSTAFFGLHLGRSPAYARDLAPGGRLEIPGVTLEREP